MWSKPLSREELRELLANDMKLQEEIVPKSPAPSITEARCVLITGVTGNMGTYFLRWLANYPQIERIYCLLRGQSRGASRLRLMEILKQKGMTESVCCIVSDV